VEFRGEGEVQLFTAQNSSFTYVTFLSLQFARPKAYFVPMTGVLAPAQLAAGRIPSGMEMILILNI
jgi:hypothetical protein